MIEILNKRTGKVLHVIEDDIIAAAEASVHNVRGTKLSKNYMPGINLSGAKLAHAKLIGWDLSGADFRYADLTDADFNDSRLLGAHFKSAILNRTIFNYTNLNGVDFSDANLIYADLRTPFLTDANFTNANLKGAELEGANLSNSNLTNAYLGNADLSHANLSSVDFSHAQMGYTQFSYCHNLHLAKGLDLVTHQAPSLLDAATLRSSIASLPDVFLRGIGYNNQEIETLRALYTDDTIQHPSYYISYSQDDKAFAQRLYSRLVQANIRVWYSSEVMKSAAKNYIQIWQTIRDDDRILMVLSEESMTSDWIATELQMAFRIKRQNGLRTLFPIRVTDWHAIEAWQCLDRKDEDLAAKVREYDIPDFSHWQDANAFEAAFQNLLESFQADEYSSVLY